MLKTVLVVLAVLVAARGTPNRDGRSYLARITISLSDAMRRTVIHERIAAATSTEIPDRGWASMMKHWFVCIRGSTIESGMRPNLSAGLITLLRLRHGPSRMKPETCDICRAPT